MKTHLNFSNLLQAVPPLIRFPEHRFQVDYDCEADVLYLSFQRPQKTTDTRLTDDGMLLRYRGKKLVGITILEASQRAPAKRLKKAKSKSRSLA
jgi:uncharacterized protein YuzE